MKTSQNILVMVGMIAALMGSTRLAIGESLPPPVTFSPPPVRCGTCEYFEQQHKRITSGKAPIEDPRFVPKGYWMWDLAIPKSRTIRQDRLSSPMEAPLYWPRWYYRIHESRTDSDSDGLRECRYQIDFSDLQGAGYSVEQILAIDDVCRGSLAMWNDALAYVGLEFLEVQDDNFHIKFSAEEWTGEDQVPAGWAGFHSAFSGVEGFGLQGVALNRDTTILGAPLYPLVDDTARAVARRPPGNPYVAVYPWSEVYGTDTLGQPAWIQPVSWLLQHEIGHTIGLEHTWAGFVRSSSGEDDTNLTDWLAWPRITAFPPSATSFLYDGEDFHRSGWSRRFFNTFMTYDNSRIMLFLDIPAPTKAFLAHYYARNDYEGAQRLLDLAIEEHNTYSWLAQDKCIQECEPNDSPETSMSLQIDLPLLGALSSVNSASRSSFGTYEGQEGFALQESQEDFQDWYRFSISDANIGRELTAQLGMGSWPESPA